MRRKGRYVRCLAATTGAGPAHPHTLACQVNLAGALRYTGPHEEALDTIRHAVDGLVAALGDKHPYTLAAKMVMGVLLADQGDLEAAERLEANTAEALARVLTADHPDTLRCRAKLGRSLASNAAIVPPPRSEQQRLTNSRYSSERITRV